MNEAAYEVERGEILDDRLGCLDRVPRIAVVIPFFIPKGRTKDYGHFIENKLETIKKTLAAHAHFEPTLPESTETMVYDIILVDNGSEELESLWPVDFLADIRSMPSHIKAVHKRHRENEGYGFGAWKDTMEALIDEYDFFICTEDDNAPAKDGWLADIRDLWLSDPEIGAVGNVVESHGPNPIADEVRALLHSDRHTLYNFDGAYTAVSAAVVRQVMARGGFPVFPCQPKHELSATVNELAFQQPILELGYKLAAFAGRGVFVLHGSEIFTGECANRGPMGPIVNPNAGRIVPEIAEAFAWYA